MALTNDQQVANTRVKLARLEARYEALRSETGGNHRVRELSMRSLKRLINQFKEEIARYETQQRDLVSAARRNGSRELTDEQQVENTRRKLQELEELYAANKGETGDDELRRAEQVSLKRIINQFKEEIARYEARQPARSEG